MANKQAASSVQYDYFTSKTFPIGNKELQIKFFGLSRTTTVFKQTKAFKYFKSDKKETNKKGVLSGSGFFGEL